MLRSLWRRLAAYWLGMEPAPAPAGTIASVSAEGSPVLEIASLDPPAISEVTAAVEPLEAMPVATKPKSKFRFAARMRSVARLNKNKSRVRAARRTKAKPKCVKRAPPLYPVKNKKIVPKRAKTRIVVAKPKKSAIILRFPARPQRAAMARHQRVA